MPQDGDLAVPVDLTVTGEPQIELGNMSLEFGEVLIGYPVSKGLLINNTGTDVVNVTSVSGQSGLFMADGLPLSVPAMGSLAVEIQFAPTATGLVEDTLLIASDDPINPELELPVSGTGVELPEISLIPEEIVVNLFTDSVYHGEMYIENTGASDLRWVINLPDREIESVLDNLNANYTDILDLIPSRYDFSYDGDDYEINDGGDDMYDGANMLSTDLSGSDIRYSDNVIREGFNYFGPGSRYFTRHLAGLFVMVADLNGVGSFEINGNNGADGGGSYDGSILEKQIGTTHYTAFIKRVYGTSDPSINHMIIIKTSPGADHEYSTNTNDDYHRVFGLENSSRLYYLLYAGASGLYIDDTEAEAIMTQFLSSVEESWIIFDPMIDTAAAGGMRCLS